MPETSFILLALHRYFETFEAQTPDVVARVRLTMVADSRRIHVALVDPLPAGLEPVNPEQAVVGGVPVGPADEEPFEDRGVGGSATSSSLLPTWRREQWFEHQNLRDDRAEAFTSLLSAGTHDDAHVARATTPGTFVPPTRAEEYAPATFGRAASDIVVVVEGSSDAD